MAMTSGEPPEKRDYDPGQLAQSANRLVEEAELLKHWATVLRHPSDHEPEAVTHALGLARLLEHHAQAWTELRTSAQRARRVVAELEFYVSYWEMCRESGFHGNLTPELISEKLRRDDPDGLGRIPAHAWKVAIDQWRGFSRQGAGPRRRAERAKRFDWRDVVIELMEYFSPVVTVARRRKELDRWVRPDELVR